MKKKIPPLFPDQESSVKFELKKGIAFDASEPGTGKTRVRWEVFAKRRVKGGGCMLVLAPRSLLRSAWEVDGLQYTPWLRSSVAFALNRKAAFSAKADAYITNHDAVKWLAQQPATFFKKFDYLVIDESDAFKHHTSQRSKALNKIKKHFKHRCIMNGTPTPVSVTDLWNQVNILDDGQRLGTSFYAFRSAVCTPQQVGPRANMLKWRDRDGVQEQVSALINDITIRNLLKNVPKNHIRPPMPFFMEPKHLAAYKEMERDAILQLKTGEISAVNAASLSTKLLQIASGAVYDDTGEYHVIDTSRYELVADLVEARPHTVIFFLWTHQRDLLIEEFKRRDLTYMVIDGSVGDARRGKNVSMYQQGMFRAALLHPKSAAHGLTLTTGTTTIWPSPTHDLMWWIQGNARISRTGQKVETETISIIADGTYEEAVFANRDSKDVRQIDLLRTLVT